jgi:peptidyl-prolyl cis-trans isomerase SurA
MPAMLHSLILSAHRAPLLVALCLALTPLAGSAQPAAPLSRPADFIVAVVNQELVTNAEVRQRVASLRREAAQSGQRLPDDDALLKQGLESLIDERAQLTHARESGVRVDAAELDRTVANVASQNRITLSQLREQLRREGIDYDRFRRNLRDQLLLERVREREVQALIKISESEIDAQLASRASGVAPPEFNLAQLLISVPEGAANPEVAERRAIAEKALARAMAGEDFGKLVAELSNGAKEQGGALGMRSADRLPDLFVEAVQGLRAGQVHARLVQSGAGFHVLKLVDKREGGMMVTQTRSRHILLRTTAQLSQKAAIARLAEFKKQVEAGTASFAQLAREHSEDGSASQGGDLGWAAPGQFVPEFEEAMKPLAPNEMSNPVVSRYGVHLIQVTERREQAVDRKQQREMARNMIREQKFAAAYEEWARDVRARAYVEMREAAQ